MWALRLLLCVAGLRLDASAGVRNATRAATGNVYVNSASDEEQARAALAPPTRIRCGDKDVLVPRSMVLVTHGGGQALWCPNAKVATSSIYALLLEEIAPGSSKHTKSDNGTIYFEDCEDCRCQEDCPAALQEFGFESAWRVPPQRHQEICNAHAFSFVRNPWDRIRSCYQDKIESHAHWDGMSFPEFVRYATQHPLENIHWMPFSKRCHTSGPDPFPYSHVGQLESGFDAQVAAALAESGIASVGAAAVPHVLDSGTAAGAADRAAWYLVPGLAHERELVNLVQAAYAADIRAGGYSFDA